LAELAYAVKTNDAVAVVVDGKVGESYDSVINGSLQISPDGTRIAYAAKRGTESFVVVDGTRSKAYRYTGWGNTPVFSPDGRYVAYIASTGNSLDSASIVVNDTELSGWSLTDHSRLIFDSANRFHTLVRKGLTFYRLDVEIKGK
jgi:hypothetical protein